MTVLVVVPGEEFAAEGAGVVEGGEALREVGAVLEVLKLRLGEGIVVADAGTAERSTDAQRKEHVGDGAGVE